VHALAQRHLGAVTAGAPAPVEPFSPTQTKPRRRHVASPGSQTDLRVSFLTPGERDAQAAAIELLMRVIDDGMSTRLYHRLCDAGGLVYDCSASWEPFLDCGAIDFAAEVQHARVPEVTEACLAIARELADEGPTQDEVDKARDRHRWDVEAAVDDAGELASFAGAATFFGRDGDLSRHAARYDQLSAADVQRAAATVFAPKNLAVVTIGSVTGTARERLRAIVTGFGG
jgi:predicted Zn-dependent peptidase